MKNILFRNHKTNISVLFAVLFIALTAVYWNHFDNGFHFDDSHTIVENGYITEISNIPLFFLDSRTESTLPQNQTYRPIITSLNAFDYWVAGRLDVTVFHWHIFLEFLLLLVILYFVLLKVFQLSSGRMHRYAALFGTAFFAFHTATAETINYIIARSDGFSTLMVLTGTLIFINSDSWKKNLALIPFLIGCLAKPTTLMLAPLLFLYCLFLEKPSLFVRTEQPAFRLAIVRAVKGTALFFVCGAGMYLFTRSMYPDTWIPGGNSVLHYLNTQPFVILVYLKTFVLPTGLSADSDLKVISDLLAPRVLIGILVIVVLLMVAFAASLRRNTLPIAFGILWFFVCLIPTSSVIPLAEVLNHHRTFMPYIGLVLATTWAGFLLLSRLLTKHQSNQTPVVIFSLCLIFLGLHGHGTYQRNEVWDTGLTLWHDVSIKSPNNGRGLMNYGLALMARGNYEDAIRYFKLAQTTDYGTHPYLYINLGIATNALGNRDDSELLRAEAEKYFKTAIRNGSDFPQTHYRYARWLHHNQRSSEAFSFAQKAIELSPANKAARELLQSITVITEQQLDFAKRNAEELNSAAAFLNLSLQFYNLEQYENCITAANRALELNPEYASAYNNICSANIMLQNFRLAIDSCEQALLLDPNHSNAKGNLKWAKDQLHSSQ